MKPTYKKPELKPVIEINRKTIVGVSFGFDDDENSNLLKFCQKDDKILAILPDTLHVRVPKIFCKLEQKV